VLRVKFHIICNEGIFISRIKVTLEETIRGLKIVEQFHLCKHPTFGFFKQIFAVLHLHYVSV
jgi:hypothetical protein